MRSPLGLWLLGTSASMVASVLAMACTPKNPPTPQSIDASVAPLPPPHPTDASATASAEDATDAGAPMATADSGAAATTSAALVDAGDPGILPQTHDKPAPSSPALDARTATLWDAIVHDDPDRALPFFFPVTAYEQVKAITYPASDWRRRLVAAYKRDLHGLAKRLGDKASQAKFLRLDVPDERARWVDVNEESNKLGYYRVYGTHLVYELDGKERTFEISSLISWRGEWYVVHLTGFK